MTAVAACFTLAFAPILWFLQVTMGQGSTAITPHGISILLLATSLLAGLGRLTAYLREAPLLGVNVSLPLLLGWQALFTFICYRMAGVLGLLE